MYTMMYNLSNIIYNILYIIILYYFIEREREQVCYAGTEVLHAQILPQVYNSIESEFYKKDPKSSLYMFPCMELFGMLENYKPCVSLTLAYLCTVPIILNIL